MGSAYPYFHATAPGKVYLAHMEAEKRNRVMKRMGLPRITAHTITRLGDMILRESRTLSAELREQDTGDRLPAGVFWEGCHA